jgi:peptidoglycan/LPS O-acetylase OafA/YrhL
VLFPPQQYRDFGRSVLATTFFASNIYFNHVSVGAGYFEPSTGTQLLLHLWSLGVEEQFYLLFPILLILLSRVNRRHTGTILGLLAVLSFAANIWMTAHATSAAFYLLPGRAWELLIGCLLAVAPLPPVRSLPLRNLLLTLGIGVIVYGVTQLSVASVFPGYNALIPCAGAALAIYAGQAPSLTRRILGCPPLAFVGAISFSLYLWHWPLLAVARFLYVSRQLHWTEAVYALLASAILACLSFQFIETPFRTRRANSSSVSVVRRGVVANALLAVLAVVIIATHGLPTRFQPGKRATMIENYERKSEVTQAIGECGNWRTNPSRFSDVNFCMIGHAPKNILFWGDSHVTQLVPLLQDFQRNDLLHGEGVVVAAAATCPPSEHVNVTYTGFHCGKLANYALQRAMMPDIDTVFILFSPWWAVPPGMACIANSADICQRKLTGQEAEQLVVEEMEGHIRALHAAGKRVIVSMPFPTYNMLIPDYQQRKLALGHFGPAKLYPIDITHFVDSEQLRQVAERTHAQIYEPRPVLCPLGDCRLEIKGVSIYSDSSHLAVSQLPILRESLLKALQPQD